jgi:hypothetical protein
MLDIKEMPFNLTTEDKVHDQLKAQFTTSTGNKTEEEKQVIGPFGKDDDTFFKHEKDLYHGCLACAYRSTPNKTTKLTTNLLTIGREIRLLADLIFQHVDGTAGTITNLGDYVQSQKDKMLHAHEVAGRHLGADAKRQKEIYDAKLSFTKYSTGDLVWCLHETRKVGVTPKLEKAFDAPFVIKTKMSDITFVLQVDEKGTERLVHHYKLKLYLGTSPPL